MLTSKNQFYPIQVRLCIEVEVHYYSKSRTYMLYDSENKREVGTIIDVNRDGNSKFFTSFHEGNPLNASIVLKDEYKIIQNLQNGKNTIRLELQIHENVVSFGRLQSYFPRKDGKNPNLFLKGELKEVYCLYMDPKSKKWTVYCFDYWGELIEPNNPYDFWC